MLKSEVAANRALIKLTKKENKDPGGLVIKEEAEEEPPSRSSPDSSTDPWHCNGNKIIVVPPQSPSRTRCPVCRKHVNDLSHHFAVEHSENANGQEASQEPPSGQAALISNGATTSLRRIIPIVLPNGQNQAESIPTNGDLNNVTIIPMSNGNYSSSASGTRSSTPHSLESNDNHPVNLSVRKDSSEMSENMESESNYDAANGMFIAQATSALGRKRRKQTHVPDGNKDEKYWARRLKNNEAAKKSRDMRIRREKVIFEENMRLESMVKELRNENEALSTENKELQLKLGFILDENVRLQSLIPGSKKEN